MIHLILLNTHSLYSHSFTEEKRVNSFPWFPYESTVQHGTVAFLTSEFEWDQVEPRPYGRSRCLNMLVLFKGNALRLGKLIKNIGILY